MGKLTSMMPDLMESNMDVRGGAELLMMAKEGK